MRLWFYNQYLRLLMRLMKSARVYENAKVIGYARVSSDAMVCGNSILEGDVTISSGWIFDVHWWRNVP